MKTIIFGIISSLLFSFALIHTSYASCPSSDSTYISAADYLRGCKGTHGVGAEAGSSTDGTKRLVKSVAQQAISFGALFAIGAIVYAGIQYTTSFGDEEKLNKAKMTGIYGLAGLILMLVAFSLVDIILNIIFNIFGKNP